MNAPARMEPFYSDVAEPFWQATTRSQLLLQWCRACDRAIHYPRVVCPSCLGDDLEWREASGRGVVYACTVMHRAGLPQMADRVPYVVALVDLDEGVRFMSNVVGCEPSAVRVGQRVRVAWEPLSEGRQWPVFEPDEREDRT